jgi:CheY-like chemotaxis protein
MCLIKANSGPVQVVAAVQKAISLRAKPSPEVKNEAQMVAATSLRPPVEPENHTGFRAENLNAFVSNADSKMKEIWSLWGRFLLATGSSEQRCELMKIKRKLHEFGGNAAAVESLHAATLSSALEALIKELCHQPDGINSSTTRTVESTMDFLGSIAKRAPLACGAGADKPRVLVVDDEIIALTTAEAALDLVNLKSTLISDPFQALALLKENPYDLVFLDIDMPGMTGLEICTQMRSLPRHEKTQVIFVTGMTSFDSRVQSAGSEEMTLSENRFL